jgi:dTDP-4-amino-4,6-dideoxygalactose transaminase
MTDLQAALGLSQLQRIDAFVARRRELAYRSLRDLPLTLLWQHPDCCSARHLYVIKLNLQLLEKTRLEVFEALRQVGIGVNVHYIPVHYAIILPDAGF